MLDSEFKNEFSRRSNFFYGESGFHELYEEFNSLDPRESRLIQRVVNYPKDSVEYLHSKIRVSALVASGVISEKLGKVATFEIETPKPVKENTLTPYQLSRLNLAAALGLFNVTESGDNIMDPSGELEYRIERGDSQDSIREFLESSTVFNAFREFTESNPANDDFDSQLVAFKYNELADALDGLKDLDQPLDHVAIAKEKIKEYDEFENISKLIDSGAKSSEIFDALEANPKWADDASDFITKDFVDSPRYLQTKKWNEFLRTVNSIKDLDNL
jgi:hypothetical protein